MISKQLSKLLSDNLEYYYNDTSKRCVIGNNCNYSGKTLGIDTDGCFVGKLLSPELRLKLDKEFPNESDWTTLLEEITNIKKIPEWMIKEAKLLTRFQSFHDKNHYWDLEKRKGLTEDGKKELCNIVDTYKLNINDFNKFLN